MYLVLKTTTHHLLLQGTYKNNETEILPKVVSILKNILYLKFTNTNENCRFSGEKIWSRKFIYKYVFFVKISQVNMCLLIYNTKKLEYLDIGVVYHTAFCHFIWFNTIHTQSYSSPSLYKEDNYQVKNSSNMERIHFIFTLVTTETWNL